MNDHQPRLLYCNCSFANVIEPAVKSEVLRKLCDSERTFEAVADLCEMSARKDPALQQLVACDNIKIAACFPRAVKGLFHSAGMPLSGKNAEVLNMRTSDAETVVDRLLADDVQPNIPPDKQANGPTSANEIAAAPADSIESAEPKSV